MASDVLERDDMDETGEVEDMDGTETVDSDEEPGGGMPPKPKPLGMMVAFLPSDIELDQIEVPGGLDGNDLHCTLRYYGEVTDDAFREQVHEAARTIAGNFQPFLASVQGRRQLGDDDPPADVLVLADHKAFRMAREKLPPSDKDYPAFLPHITVGYGIGDDGLARSNPDNEVLFDHIVVAEGNDDWTVYMLGDIPPEALDGVDPDAYDDTLTSVADVPLPADDGADPEADDDNDETRGVVAGLGMNYETLLPYARNPLLLSGLIDDIPMPPLDDETAVTAGIDDAIEGKVGVGSRNGKPGKSLDPRPKGKNQRCFHGSPASCKSVKWIAVYTALREKRGFSKSKAAAIANAMHNKWKRGQPNKPGQRPMIRKTI